MGNSASIVPVTATQDKETNSAEKPEDTNKCPDNSCDMSAKDAKLTTPVVNTSKVIDTKTADGTSKVPSSAPKQVTQTTTQSNVPKVSAPKSPEILPSKAPSSPPKQVTVNTPQGNVPKVSDPKSPEVLPSKAPSSPTKQVTPNAAQDNVPKVSQPKSPEVLPSKAPSSPPKQVTPNAAQDNVPKVSQPKSPEVLTSQKQVTLNTTKDNGSKVSKSTKSSEILTSKAPSSAPKQVTLNITQDNVPKVSNSKGPDVLPSKVLSSSPKQECASTCPLIVTPDIRISKDSTDTAETTTDMDENKKGLKLPTSNISRLSRFWTSLQNLKGRMTIQRWSAAVTPLSLHKVESESALSIDSRVESGIFLNQNKLDDTLDHFKKKLSILLVFPKADRQYKVFCEAIHKSDNFQPSHAENSKSAIMYCKEYTFDLILIDARHKKLLDAKELCRNLRAHNPRTVIIAVRQKTVLPNSDLLSSYIDAGFTKAFLENHSVTICQDALTDFEKDVDSKIQLRLLKGLFSAVEQCHESIEIASANHELQFVNKAYERLLGCSMVEVIGKPWYEQMAFERNPADQTMKIKQQLDSSNAWEGNNYLKKKSGEQILNYCRVVPLIEAGKVLQFIGIRKIMDSKQNEPKQLDSPSGSNQSAWPMATLSDLHTGSRRISSGLRERMMSITATNSPHCLFSNPNLVIEITAALAGVKLYQCPQNVYQIIDRVTEMIRSSDRSKNVSTIIKEDDELITELLDGLMTSSIPTNVEEDLRGRRRSTYYPTSKSVSRMVSRLSEVGNTSISPLPLANNMQSSAVEIRKLLDNVFSWNFNLLRLEELTGKRPLLYVGLKVFQTFEVYSFLNTDAATFKNWLDIIEQHYNSYNPYHNSTHAADVLQAAASLCRREKLAEIFDDMDVVSTLLSAAIHDLDHPGKTNSFLINSGHKLAILYNDVSVLENHHTALAFRLTFKDNSANIFLKLEKDDFRILRQQIIDMVLATDMTKHFDYLGRFNDIMRRPSAELIPTNLGARMYPVEFRTVVKRMLIKCCDVSNPTRPLESCKVWAERIAEEYCRQTDEEKARGLQVVMPIFDRAKCNIPKTQLSFMNLFIINMMESWNEFCPVPDLIRNLEINFDYWQQIEPTTKEKVVRVVTN